MFIKISLSIMSDNPSRYVQQSL